MYSPRGLFTPGMLSLADAVVTSTLSAGRGQITEEEPDVLPLSLLRGSFAAGALFLVVGVNQSAMMTIAVTWVDDGDPTSTDVRILRQVGFDGAVGSRHLGVISLGLLVQHCLAETPMPNPSWAL